MHHVHNGLSGAEVEMHQQQPPSCSQEPECVSTLAGDAGAAHNLATAQANADLLHAALYCIHSLARVQANAALLCAALYCTLDDSQKLARAALALACLLELHLHLLLEHQIIEL